ncbi:hypothetical protein KDK_14030 [Dictyobacter kobayashii]|uniref:Uncharacterized protein n=1 Tax=Dictyobacter kobayashii TaxID=2014872 RepID=A0A402AEU8_9CHLR|nr:hypothetical protein KDK_14030 [Dictyobacter kobayashii]
MFSNVYLYSKLLKSNQKRRLDAASSAATGSGVVEERNVSGFAHTIERQIITGIAMHITKGNFDGK